MVNYDAFASTFSKSRQDHPWPELDSIISDIESQGYTSVLDVGCGNGRFIEQMTNDRGQMINGTIRYLGIDSSIGMIEEARRLHPGYDFKVCDMLSLREMSQKQFDAVVFLASFHHLETREARLRVLLSTKKLLIPGGRVYMTNWNLRDQPKYDKSHRGDGDYDIKIGEYTRYYHGFTTDELEGLFTEAGYTIERNEVWGGGRNVVTTLML